MTKEEIYVVIDESYDLLEKIHENLDALHEMVELLPDASTSPDSEPTPEIVRDIEPVSDTQPARVNIMKLPFYPYWAVTGLHQIGPANVLSVKVQDGFGTPLDGIDIRVEIEDTNIAFEQKSGAKAPGQAEFVIDRNRYMVWIVESASTDTVSGITTNIEIDQGDMRNRHVETEVTFTRVMR